MPTQPNDGLKGLTKPEKLGLAGIVANKAHQDPLGFLQANDFQLAIVEFDDQGRAYGARKQLDLVSQRIEQMRENAEDVILLLFVHGWKHNADTADSNLTAFRGILQQTATHEKECAGAKARPVMGIFVGWRGMTVYGPTDLVADVSFWGRQEAGHRVSTGSVRELFGRLRHYRNSRLKRQGNPLLVIAGHSFGGMIVYSALAQSLIEAASAPGDHVVPGFADLVLLANPAIEGARYLPVYDLVSSTAFGPRLDAQLPVFVCAQALNDSAVGTAFPIGNLKHQIEEATIGDLERRCVSHGLGFIDEFRTHHIAGPSGDDPFVLTPPAIKQKNPFWVVAAEKAVIDGHNGIWQQPFLDFLAAILFQHVNLSRGAPAPATPAGPASGGPAAGSGVVPLAAAVGAKAAAAPASSNGDLATFARTIDPIQLPDNTAE